MKKILFFFLVLTGVAKAQSDIIPVAVEISRQQASQGGGAELYVTANALSTTNETNSTTGISRVSTQISSPVLESTIVQDGSYSVKFTLNATGTNSFGTVELALDGNGTYDLTFKIYSSDGGQRIRSITNSDYGENLLTQTTNTWEEFTATFVVSNGASTATLEIGRGGAGEFFYLDNFSLTKQ